MSTAKVENLSDTKKKIQITVPKDEIKPFLDRALQKVGQKAKINGFRKGKVPTNILEQHYAAEINYECMNNLIAETYHKALTENKLVPLGDPSFDTKPIEKEADYSYSVELFVRPTFKLKEYKNIKIKKKEAKIDDKEFDEELQRLRESLAQLAPAEEGATVDGGLVATIDFEGRIDGEIFEGGKAADYVFELGKGQLLEEFETKIKGMKIGDERDIEVTFPKDYFEKKLAGQKSVFNIKLKNLHVKSMPELDDELAKDIGKENLEEVKKEIRDSLLQRKEREFRNTYVEDIQKKLLKEYKFEVPENVVQAEMERRKEDKDKVIEQLKIQFILETIAEEEKIQPTQQDMEQRMAAMAQMYRQPVAEIRKMYSQNNLMGMLASQIVLDKTLDFIIDNANMV